MKMYFIYFLFNISLIFNIIGMQQSSNEKFDLFCAPKSANDDSFQFKPSDMNFCFGNHRKLSFFYLNNQTFMRVCSSQQQEARFPAFDDSSIQSRSDAPYLIDQPLYYCDNDHLPTLSAEELVSILQTKKVLFYTGAGISASVVPTLDVLIESLGLSTINKDNLDSFLENCISNPEKYISTMNQFYRSYIDGTPTACHNALKTIALSLQAKIITENVDFLHKKTGIEVPLLEAGWAQQNITTQSLSYIDVLICIGLRSDERGFLAWYKKCNPYGSIIAINIKKPDYLEPDNDFFIEADAQIIVPTIEKLLVKTKRSN